MSIEHHSTLPTAPLATSAGEAETTQTRHRIPIVQLRDRIATWAPGILSFLILCLLLLHAAVLYGLKDPKDLFWVDVTENASSYYLWAAPFYRYALGLAVGLLVAAVVLNLYALERTHAQPFARGVSLVAAVAAIATQLMQPGFWQLGAGLSDWTWGLPLRLGLLAAAVGALWWQGRSRRRAPRWLLTGGVALVVALLVVPQPSQGHQPQSLVLYCGIYGPKCDQPPPSCQGDLAVSAGNPAIPAAKLAATVPIRQKAQQRLDKRLALKNDRSSVPDAWYNMAGDQPFYGSEPWKMQHRELSNMKVHLHWQTVRLIALGLFLLLGLALVLGRWLRPTATWWRPLPVPLALTAVITATGLLPEHSNVSLLAHLPSALLLPVGVGLVWAAGRTWSARK